MGVSGRWAGLAVAAAAWITPGVAAAAAGADGPPRTAVEAVPVEAGTVRDELWSYGTLEPQQTVKIASQTAGSIDAILFKPGERVKAGQPLIRLDERIARARVEAAEAKAALTDENLQRASQLASRGLQTVANLDQARADSVAANASLRVEETQLKLLTLTAPFDGIVAPAEFDAGAYVSPGQTIVQLEDRSALRLVFRVSENELPKLKPGQPFTVMAASLGGRVLEGRVVYFDSSIETANRSVVVRGEIANADYAVMAGLFVRVRLLLGERPGTLLVPETAVMATLAGPYVFRVQDGVARRTPVKTGARQDGRIEVVSGLKAGEQVVVVGQFKLEDGVPVTVKTAAR